MQKNNSLKSYVLIWAILLAVFNAIVFIPPFGDDRFTDTFWIGYAFVTLSFLGQLLCAYISFKDGNLSKAFYNIPLFTVSIVSVVVSTIAGSILMAIPTLESWVAALVCIIILAFVAIATLRASAAGDAVSAIDDKIKTQTFFIRALTIDAQNLVARANTPETKAVVNKVYEAIRYSDPMSNEKLSDIENRISYEFKSFEMAVLNGDVALINHQANELLILISNRNSRCKLLK